MQNDVGTVGREQRWGAPEAVLVVIGAHIAGFVWAGIMVSAGILSTSGSPYPVGELAVGGIGLWLSFVVGSVLVTRHMGRGPLLDLGLSVQRTDLGVGLVAGVATNLALVPLYLLVGLVWDADPQQAAQKQIDVVSGVGDWLLFVLVVVVIAPVVEEVAYRGLLLRGLQSRSGPVPALVISSAVFAFFHILSGAIVLPGIFLFGLVAGALRLHFDRLAPSIFMHMAFNATTVIAGAFLAFS